MEELEMVNARLTIARTAIVLASLFFSQTALTMMPTKPVSDRNFLQLPDGRWLSNVMVRGSRLTLTKGLGNKMSASSMQTYQKLKADSKSNRDHKVQWVLMDLDGKRILDQSLNANRKMFGASSSKIFVGATLLSKQSGGLTDKQLRQMGDMLVVSDNNAWIDLQRQIGDGDADKGRELNYRFTQDMGYELTRGFQGYWGKMHGNELTALETTEFLRDMYWGHFWGAETLWKIMHTCRTGGSRGLKYFPKNIFVGGKTGTYDGPTEDPETGKEVVVKTRNHVMVFNYEGRQYGLTIFANNGSDESVALMAGGLLRDVLGYKD